MTAPAQLTMTPVTNPTVLYLHNSLWIQRQTQHDSICTPHYDYNCKLNIAPPAQLTMTTTTNSTWLHLHNSLWLQLQIQQYSTCTTHYDYSYKSNSTPSAQLTILYDYNYKLNANVTDHLISSQDCARSDPLCKPLDRSDRCKTLSV